MFSDKKRQQHMICTSMNNLEQITYRFTISSHDSKPGAGLGFERVFTDFSLGAVANTQTLFGRKEGRDSRCIYSLLEH